MTKSLGAGRTNTDLWIVLCHDACLERLIYTESLTKTKSTKLASGALFNQTDEFEANVCMKLVELQWYPKVSRPCFNLI